MTFDQWMAKVNGHIDRLTGGFGLDADSIPDWDYRMAFDAGMTALDAARAAVRAAKNS